MKWSKHGAGICIPSLRVRPRLQQGHFPSMNSAAAFPHLALGLPRDFTFLVCMPRQRFIHVVCCFALRTRVAIFFEAC